MKKYDTVVLGFTFLGAGAALNNPENTLIIERVSLVGSEFVDSLNFKKIKNLNFKTELGRELYQDLLTEGNISKDGCIYEFAALVEICRRFSESKAEALFLTEIADIRAGDGGYYLTFHNQEGASTIFANRILDTRSESALYDENVRATAKKYLNCAAEGPDLPENTITGYKIFSFPAELEEDIISVRSRLYEHLNRCEELRVHHVSNTFAFEMAPVKLNKAENYIASPSCGYGSLLEAFDEGGTIFDCIEKDGL